MTIKERVTDFSWVFDSDALVGQPFFGITAVTKRTYTTMHVLSFLRSYAWASKSPTNDYLVTFNIKIGDNIWNVIDDCILIFGNLMLNVCMYCFRRSSADGSAARGGGAARAGRMHRVLRRRYTLPINIFIIIIVFHLHQLICTCSYIFLNLFDIYKCRYIDRFY